MSSEANKKNLPREAPPQNNHQAVINVPGDDEKQVIEPDEKVKMSAHEEAKHKKQEYAHQQPGQGRHDVNIKQHQQYANHGRDRGERDLQRRAQNH